ncbi:MAG: type IV pilus modification PilV family protein [Planctomycetota bacterium]|jgi:prepilin-type N-terminal cleavage/methylation domain-containing protein
MNRRGFTLIEVIMAIAIFMFGITAILGLFQVGGNLEQDARVQAELAPAVEPLVERIRADAWMTDPQGKVTGLRDYKGEAVPGAPSYRFDLVVRPAGENPALRHAELRFYRKSPDRILTRVPFLLEQEVPIARVQKGKNP